MQTSKNFNDMAADRRWVYTMGVMDAARRDLAKLAPHPANKDGQTMAASSDQQRRPLGNDRDSLLGGLIVSGLFGVDLGDVLCDTLGAPDMVEDTIESVNWGMAVNVYDEYVIDREQSRQNRAANTGYELGDRQVICGGFNRQSQPAKTKTANDRAWDAYWTDLPERRVMEQNIHALNRDLAMREKMQFRKLRAFAI